MSPQLLGFCVGALLGTRLVSLIGRWLALRFTADRFIAAAAGALAVAGLAALSWAADFMPLQHVAIYLACSVVWAAWDGLRARTLK